MVTAEYLNEYSVSIKREEAGALHRKCYENSAYGRAALAAEVEAGLAATVLAVWGETCIL